MKIHSVFNILAAALLILAVGMVAVPDASSRAILADEAVVVRALQQLALAEVRHRTAGLADQDADGSAEFVFLPELLSAHDRLPSSISEADPSGRVHVRGYRIAAMLPDSSGHPLSLASASGVDAQLASRSFLIVAVPTEPERTGYKAYAIRQDLLVAQCDAAEPRWRAGNHPLPRLARRDPSTGQILTPDSWRRPWVPFLLDIQAPWMIARLRAENLPIPPGLSAIVGNE